MADSFLQFSTSIKNLKKKEREWVKGHLGIFEKWNHDTIEEGTQEHDAFCDLIGVYGFEDGDDTLGFDWQLEDDKGLWIYAQLNGNVEHVATFVQMFLQKFRPNSAFAMGWAQTCSSPLLDSFGGGAVFVTAKEIEYNSSWGWTVRQWKKFRGEAGK